MELVEKARNELKQARAVYEQKLSHFQALHSIAKRTKKELAELTVLIDGLEKKVNGLSEKGK